MPVWAARLAAHAGGQARGIDRKRKGAIVERRLWDLAVRALLHAYRLTCTLSGSAAAGPCGRTQRQGPTANGFWSVSPLQPTDL